MVRGPQFEKRWLKGKYVHLTLPKTSFHSRAFFSFSPPPAEEKDSLSSSINPRIFANCTYTCKPHVMSPIGVGIISFQIMEADRRPAGGFQNPLKIDFSSRNATVF